MKATSMEQTATDQQASNLRAQLNLGEGCRIAGHDYHETRIPDSVKMYLATIPSSQLDEKAIDNERLFAYRFGIDVPRHVREQVIAIKHRYGFTDAEIRGLRRGGQLSVMRSEARLKPDKLLPTVGWVYLAFTSLVGILRLMIVTHSTASQWKQGLGFISIAAVWFPINWVIGKVHIWPWRVLRLAGAR